MGVMPLPKTSSLFLQSATSSFTMTPDSPSVGEFGRLHFTASEIRQLERLERTKTMALEIIDYGALPRKEFGRRATEPKIGFTENGQFSFNSLVQKQWEGVGKLLVQFDSEKRRLVFKGYKAEDKVKDKQGNEIPDSKFLPVRWGKEKDGKLNGSLAATGSPMLTHIGYDYAESGNQSFPLRWDEKAKVFVMDGVPKGALPKKPTVPRKKKAEVAAKATTNGAPPVNVQDEELIEVS